MYKQIEKPKENKSRATVNSVAQKSNNKSNYGIVDNRGSKAIQLKKNMNSHDIPLTQPVSIASTIQLSEDEARIFVASKNIPLDSYEFVGGNYAMGAGNCHGYTFLEDEECSSPQDAESIVSNYIDFLNGETAITIFMKGGEVMHSARGHGADCIHKMGENGPIIKCDAQVYATAFEYDTVYRFPVELQKFKDDNNIE